MNQPTPEKLMRRVGVAGLVFLVAGLVAMWFHYRKHPDHQVRFVHHGSTVELYIDGVRQ